MTQYILNTFFRAMYLLSTDGFAWTMVQDTPAAFNRKSNRITLLTARTVDPIGNLTYDIGGAVLNLRVDQMVTFVTPVNASAGLYRHRMVDTNAVALGEAPGLFTDTMATLVEDADRDPYRLNPDKGVSVQPYVDTSGTFNLESNTELAGNLTDGPEPEGGDEYSDPGWGE